ncbi:hypothetical protein M0R45_034085 [Rubus argutus]|uniref:CCHC-type domain-containing protein n=1 Tax=Rubus argutus TaxID=59490 RepID=A0AAW1VQA2_RUBAR
MFNQLINLQQVSEKHDTIMLNNNSWHVGTKKAPKANYDKMAKGERNPNVQGNVNGRPSPYNRSNKEGNRNHVAPNRENFTPCGRGSGGRGMGRGGHANAGHGGHNYKVYNRTHNNPPRAQVAKCTDGAGGANKLCYHCGSNDHWFRQCKASNKLVVDYKKYLIASTTSNSLPPLHLSYCFHYIYHIVSTTSNTLIILKIKSEME